MDEMLRWMRYENVRDRANREKYLKVLNNNFIEDNEYKLILTTEIKKCDIDVAQIIL